LPRGVSLFDGEKLKFESRVEIVNGSATLITGPRKLYEVNYISEYIDTDPLNKELNHKSFLTTKFDKWSNEKEFRFVSPKEGSYCFNQESLIEIIFGLRISPESKETIKKIVDARYENVKFRRIELLKERFNFELKDE
jgi:hypothetical protein